MRASPLASTSWFTSSTMVLKPAAADTCAIPAPINPQPNTPTVFIVVSDGRALRRPLAPVPSLEPPASRTRLR